MNGIGGYNPYGMAYQPNYQNMNNQWNRPNQQIVNNGQQTVAGDTNANFIVVSSIQEAKNYVVQNGQTLWFRHSSEPECYVKSVSNIGQPSFNAFKMIEFNFNENINNGIQKNYATIEQFDKLSGEVEEIKNSLNKAKTTKTTSKEAK